MQQETVNVQELCLKTSDDCAAALRGLTEKITDSSHSAFGFAQMAIRHAWSAGHVLNRAKELTGHGGFLDWLDKAAPDINERTAQRWMSLAKTTSLSDLPAIEARGKLTSAYEGIGLLPLSETHEPKPKPIFSIRFALNVEKPDSLDQVQRRTLFDSSRELLQVLEGYGFVKIMA